MKNLSRTLILLVISATTLFAQKTPQTDDRTFNYGEGGETASNFKVEKRPFYRFNFKMYPLSLATNMRVELGINFNPKVQLNVLAAYYYNIIDSRTSFLFPEFYWAPVNGQELQLSLEKAVGLRSMRIGLRAGYLHYASEDGPYSNNAGESITMERQQNQLSVQFLMRWRQEFGKRFFIEETFGLGFWYKNRVDATSFLPSQAGAKPVVVTKKNYFYTPILRFGINIGFDF